MSFDDHAGSRSTTPPSTARRLRRQRARQGEAAARRSSGPRTACSGRARGFREFFFTETGDTERDHRGGLRVRRLRRHHQADAGQPVARHGHALRCSSAATSRTPASTTSRSGDETTWSSSRTRATACTRSATRSTRRWMFDTPTGLRERATQPVRIIAQGRDAVGDDRLRAARRSARLPERRRQRDHRHPRLGRRPDSGGLLGAKHPDAVPRRLARLLHAAARRQRDLGDRSRAAGRR